MPKQLMFDDSARAKLLKGVEKLAGAVAVTMGPTGRNVIIDKSYGGPTVTKDGVTVSKEVDLEDPFENMGAKLVNEVASKTSDLAGDGTTTATVLARAIFREGTRNVAAGSNPTAVRRGIEKGVAAAVQRLMEMARKVERPEEIAQVGAISANNDRAIGDLLSEALQKVGKDGVITVEEHTRIGGLGSAVLEHCNDHMPAQAAKIARIGLPDRFATEYGSQETLLSHWGVTVESMAQAMRRQLGKD